jgi:environmental stress-induced protein Ves
MRLLRPSDYRRMPWRNGGGSTTEIVLAPGDDARFLYRVSIADVAADGPFSRFDGYERHVVVLEGAGMTLDAGPHGALALPPLSPVTFSGDWDVHGALVSGAVRDFNLIVDRAHASGTVAVRDVTAPETIAVARGETCVVHVISGGAGIAAAGDTIVAESTFALAPNAAASIVLARVQRR